ncbi:hypothetical protein [Nocardia grenadensis]
MGASGSPRRRGTSAEIRELAPEVGVEQVRAATDGELVVELLASGAGSAR